MAIFTLVPSHRTAVATDWRDIAAHMDVEWCPGESSCRTLSDGRHEKGTMSMGSKGRPILHWSQRKMTARGAVNAVMTIVRYRAMGHPLANGLYEGFHPDGGRMPTNASALYGVATGLWWVQHGRLLIVNGQPLSSFAPLQEFETSLLAQLSAADGLLDRTDVLGRRFSLSMLVRLPYLLPLLRFAAASS